MQDRPGLDASILDDVAGLQFAPVEDQSLQVAWHHVLALDEPLRNEPPIRTIAWGAEVQQQRVP